jgi:hypothetical protein
MGEMKRSLHVCTLEQFHLDFAKGGVARILSDGKSCQVMVSSVGDQHFGTWRCRINHGASLHFQVIANQPFTTKLRLLFLNLHWSPHRDSNPGSA